MRARSRRLGHALARLACGLGVTMLLAAGFWALVSLGSIAMWPIWRALKSVDVHADGLSLGPALWTNNIAMLALATILVLAGLVSGGIRSQRDVARPKLFMTTAVVVLVLVSTTAFVLGWMPLAHWIGHLFA